MKRRSDHMTSDFSEFSSLKVRKHISGMVQVESFDYPRRFGACVVDLDAPLVDKYERAYLDTLYLRASPVGSLQDIEIISFGFCL